MGPQTSFHPLKCSSNALARHLAGCGVGRAFIEGHDDVGTEFVLNLDGALRSEIHFLASDFVLERRGLVGDFDAGQGEDLEAA